ncbi:DNA replication regulator SLD2 [Phyllosticta citrichinensis]|uniref:DNA replication regulator SLD2 n=1 Tax=Phyllosticta citrichinensis TaxID=1130410 RepID=A0ABR1XHS2_9PEZI
MDSTTDIPSLCDSLKLQLKAWEKSFLDAHGRKPGRADIKAAGDIAPKYKEYGRLRDLLSGQGQPSSPKRKGDAHTTESQTPTKKAKPTIAFPDATPSRRHAAKKAPLATPSKHHGSQEEAPEAPLSATKIFNDSYMRSLLGPTPQKDGYVLGIFDLLPSATPSTERSVLGDIAPNHATPRKQDPNDESEDIWSGRRARFGRTPMSEGKRHFLDQFMSTPLKRKRDQEEQPTPSSKGLETPAFLRRDWFPMASLAEGPDSPKMPKKPRIFMRSISTLIQERRKEHEEDKRKAAEEAQQAEAQEHGDQSADEDNENHEDDEEAMRELEAEQATMSSSTKNTARRLFTSQPTAQTTAQPPEMHLGADGETHPSEDEDDGEQNAATQETRPWKKRGAKRQTRRVIMRPVHTRSKPQSQLETIPSEDESDATCVAKTQLNDSALAKNLSDTDTAVEDDSDFGEHDEKRTKSQSKPPSKAAAAADTKKDAKDKDGIVKRAARKVSATAHANFRALKIKNKNSKAKGAGGRSWGRSRR